MKKLRKLSLLLVLELGCMGAAMPGIVESEAANVTVNYFVLKTTGVEKLNQAIIESTSYSKKTVDIVEKNGTHFTAAFIASNNSEKTKGKDVLVIENLVVKSDRGFNALDGFNLTVKEGEIVGLAGVSGNGQRELAEAINGIRK